MDAGWIASTDPATGRTFYANSYTRTTQWDPPPGWTSSSSQNSGARQSASGTTNVLSDIAQARGQMEAMGMNNNQSNGRSSSGGGRRQEEDVLPDGWEEMTDAATGRKFYIDHANKITTWERPTKSASGSNGGHSGAGSGSNAASGGAGDDGFGFDPNAIMKLNQHGSHAQWDDPRSGSRAGHRDNKHQHQSSNYHSDSYKGGYSMGNSSSHPGPPPLDFAVVSVPDALRAECPGCYSGFTYTKRRHHCRLCGDVFCDACSASRTVLPLDGPEFSVPVRVCDWCMKDVKKGNYFSLRRYLTPLQLFDPNNAGRRRKVDDGAGSGEATKEITADTVAASLSSLSSDIDAMVGDPTQFQEKMTIDASVLVPSVGKHLKDRKTAEYAIRVLASLLMLGSIAGEDSFAMAVYEDDFGMRHSDSTNSLASDEMGGLKAISRNKPSEIVNDVLAVLEWNGSDARTLSAMEQAVKVVYYLTEPSFVEGAISKWDAHQRRGSEDEKEEKGEDGPVDVDEVGEAMHDLVQIDVHRAFRSMLDHATSSTSPSLQRWATATLRHLIAEDQRRACIYSSGPSRYDSFMSHLVSTGGIMILCSLLSSDDAETRTHATSTLEAIIIATRHVVLALNSSQGPGGFSARAGRGTEDDSRIVDAIVSNGGCGPALAHLLISADESVAMMGCSFASSLISPLLTDPRGSGRALQHCIAGSSSSDAKDDGLSSYRKAAVALVVGDASFSGPGGEASCLPSLIQILRSGVDANAWGNAASRSMKLQVASGECIASVALAIGHILGTTATNDHLYLRAKSALDIMERERLFDVAYRIVTSDASRSFDAARNTPQARLREAAGLVLLALSSCSDPSASYLVSNKAVSSLLAIAAESLGAPSALRGEWASRGLCHLETSAVLLLRAWKDDDESNRLTLLLDALDAGALGLASRLVKAKVHLKDHDGSYSNMRIKIATCFMLAAMFGIASANGEDGVGVSRLYSAVDADCAAALAYGGGESDGRTDLPALTIHLLGATLPYAHKFANEGGDEPLPMMDLTEACLLAAGSMCGAARGCSDVSEPASIELQPGKFSNQREDASAMACRALLASSKDRAGPLLPSVLVGALGESLVVPALRLTLAIAQNGHYEVRGDLARSGILVPVGDILQQSLSSGERYNFSVAIAIVRFCGPSAVGSSNRGSIAALQNAIRTLSCVLVIPESSDQHANDQRRNSLLSLKHESLLALEALGSNETLHSTLISDAFPSLTEFLNQADDVEADVSAEESDVMVCSALRTIQRIISLPSSASSAAAKGMTASLVKILNASGERPGCKKREVTMELLHSIALGKNDAADKSGLLSSGVFESVATLLGEGGASPKMARLGLDIIECIVVEVDSIEPNSPARDAYLRHFVNGMAGQEGLLRALIATMISTRGTSGDGSPASSLYGTPLPLPEDSNARYDVEDKAIRVLFSISWMLCSDVSGVGKEQFLHAFMLKDVCGSAETVANACCIFLQVLMNEKSGACVPANPVERPLFLDTKLPTVQSQLLEGLSSSLDECLSSNESREHAEKLICSFKIPSLCLIGCRSKGIGQAAFDLYENVVLPLSIDVLSDLLLADKNSLVALFELVTGQNNAVPDVDHAKQTFALTLGNLAKTGSLSAAVERFGVRNLAIAALSAAMQGTGDETIDENEDSLPRVCLDSLVAILSAKTYHELEITALEARTMSMAIGKILASTVLNRFFTQASLETTYDDTMDHSSDRSAISQSAEGRLLCSIASYPETLETLNKAGGLEAVGLIAHEGELAAIRAIAKACELSPKSVVDVDAHLSILDAFVEVETKLSAELSDPSNLREVVIKCIQIIMLLSQDPQTKSAVMSAEQSFGCLTAATCIISSRAKLLGQRNEVEADKIHVPTTKRPVVQNKAPVAKASEESVAVETEDLKFGDLVLIDSTQSPSKKTQTNPEQLEGVVAHLGPVQFAPGDDWIGIRLTGSSSGHGKNNGTVKGVKYFDAGSEGEKNGSFVKKANVKKQECVTEPEEEIDVEETEEEEQHSVVEEKIEPPVEAHQEQTWGRLLVKDELTLERHALSLLLGFSLSKPHRDLVMQSETLVDGISGVVLLQSPSLIDFQCKALDLLVSFTHHLHHSDAHLTELFCSVVGSRTKMLQTTRDRREQAGAKRLLASSISGLHNMFCTFMDTGEKARSLKIAADLFVFLADSLYKGPKARRSAALKEDGVLFCHLTSFFMLSMGSQSLSESILSSKFVSSCLRLVMMTAGVASLGCHILIAGSEGADYWSAALSYCLHYLSSVLNESSQQKLGTSFASLISDVETPPGAFDLCLKHIADGKLGASSISAKQILANIERLPND